MVAQARTFREVTGKVQLLGSSATDKCKGKIVRLGVSRHVQSAEFFSQTEKKPRKKKTPDDKYREHHLARFNRYADTVDKAKRRGLCQGLKYHTTLTINDASIKTGRVPTYLAREVKYLMQENNIVGISVLERGKTDDGRLHAHVLSDRRISSKWWPFGYVKSKRIKTSKNVRRYVKKSFHACEAQALYYEPITNSTTPMTDREYFSVRWGKGRKECKMIVSPALKSLEKKMASERNAKTDVMYIESAIKADSQAVYTQTFELRSTTFMTCYNDLVQQIKKLIHEGEATDSLYQYLLGSFDNFAAHVGVTHKGTCGYSLFIDFASVEKQPWTLKFYMNMETKDHWFTQQNKDDVKREFAELRRLAESYVEGEG